MSISVGGSGRFPCLDRSSALDPGGCATDDVYGGEALMQQEVNGCQAPATLGADHVDALI